MEVGFFEGHNVAKAAELLNGHSEGVVLDIGANMGSFTIPLAYYNPQFSFVCFEPQRMVCYQLCGNVALNKLQNVKVFNQGLGEHDEFFMITVPDYAEEENIGAFSLDEEVREHNDYLCKTNGKTELITVAPLDSFRIGNVKLIKIDVEGMELSVLKGGLETLKHNKYPPIMFEAWQHKEWFLPRRKELIEFLQGLGYEITEMGEDNVAIHKGESNV
jgi:FkbM family methyltransferase